MSFKVVIAGARGKMGCEVIKMITSDPQFQIVAFLDHKPTKLANHDIKVPAFSCVETCFRQINAHVLVDFTNPEASFHYLMSAVKKGVCVVSGTTGFTDEQLREIKSMANKHEIGCVIAPNFSLGAILMMEFAQQAAKYFPYVEIIDKHHDQKRDSPSGTAMRTAQLIKQTKQKGKPSKIPEQEVIKHARGARFDDMHIHSLRLPGFIAHHEVIFGGPGQTLSIKHDSIHRESFMDGLKLAIERVHDLNKFVYGLEKIIINDER